MKATHIIPLSVVCGLCWRPALKALDFDAAIRQISPPGVLLGTTATQLKTERANLFEGPSAFLPSIVGSQQAPKTFPTFMENQGVGRPGSLSYWYLVSEDRVVGILRTKSMVGLSPEVGVAEAQRLLSGLARLLGDARQETLLRKGAVAFVPVRADVWNDSTSGRTIYFVATDREITVAAVEASDFPLGQVFVQPNTERFALEKDTERTVHDIARPAVNASTSEASAMPAREAEQLPVAANPPVINAPKHPANAEAPKAVSTVETKTNDLGQVWRAVFISFVLALLAGIAFNYKRWRNR